MLIGGMFDLNIQKAYEKAAQEAFPLRCDTEHNYTRKVYTNNGRTATTYAFLHGIRLEKDAVVLLPEYNCISIVNALEAVGARFSFYGVKKDLVIDIEDLKAKITEQTKVLYVIHYFGVPQPKEIVDALLLLAKEKQLCIVEDLTQALLTRDAGRIGFGDYLVASTRKWYPVTDGGIVAAKDGVPLERIALNNAYDEAVYKQTLVSLERSYYLTDEARDVFTYLKMEKEANRARYLDFTPRAMTEASKNILFSSDHVENIRKRRENYSYLYEQLSDMDGIQVFGSRLDVNGNYVPFGFMVMVEHRDEFYSYLARHHIIGEIQWILPVEYYTPGAYAGYLSGHSLMLQCDQRYGITEMARVVTVIKEYMKGQGR